MKQFILLIITWASLMPSVFGQTEELSLEDAIMMALDNNYGITIADADAKVAAHRNNWGTAGRYPTIGFDVSQNNNYHIENGALNNSINMGLGLDWILFDGFRVNISKSTLEHSQDLAVGRLGIEVENTIEDVVLGYYGVLLEKERLEVLKMVMDLSRDRYDYELKKKSLGSSVTYQVLQAQNVFLSDKAAFLEQEVILRNALRNFNFILAEEPGKSWNFTESFEADTTHFMLSELYEKMTANNQSLKNQYVNLLLKENDVTLQESAFYPTISTSIGMNNNYSRSNTGGIIQNSNTIAPYANLRLNWDIYQGGVRRRNLEISKINEDVAQVEISQMEHALTNELYNLFDYYEVRIDLLHVADKSMEAAELNLRLSEEKYRSGVINSFNYRDVQLIYLEASLRRIQAIYNLVNSRAKLTRITGGYLQAYN